jgi:hypothetical protein
MPLDTDPDESLSANDAITPKMLAEGVDVLKTLGAMYRTRPDTLARAVFVAMMQAYEDPDG